SMTVMRMNSTAAGRRVEAVGRSLMADASFQADTSACRDKTVPGPRRKEYASEVRRITVFRRDVRPVTCMDWRQLIEMAKHDHLQGFEGQDLRNEHTNHICLFRACLFSP